MLFKNIMAYRMTKPLALPAEKLAETMQEKIFRECGASEPSSCGWVPPLGKHGSDMVHVVNGRIMICFKSASKVLPAAVINEEVEKQIEEISAKEDRVIGRKERSSIKDEVYFTLLPKALVKSDLLFAYIDTTDNSIIVNTSTPKRAEDLLVYLRETIETLPVVPLSCSMPPSRLMTEWLSGNDIPQNIEIGGACAIYDPADNKTALRCKNMDLHSDEISAHIKTGMLVEELELTFEDSIEFQINDSLTIKSVNFKDIIQDKIDKEDTKNCVEQFDIEFSIMTLELSRLRQSLITIFGGEADRIATVNCTKTEPN